MKKIVSLMMAITLLMVVVTQIGCKENSPITEYKIQCELEGNTLKGKEEIRFYNQTETAFSSLKFNLYGNAFREGAKHKPVSELYKAKAYYNGESYGQMSVEKVYTNTADLEFSVCGEDENILEVKLPEEVFPNESVCVSIEYTLILAQVVARTGINKSTINLANFYPILCGISGNSFYECVYYANGDPYFSDCANYQVTLTCDSQYVIASSGEIEKSSVKQDVQENTYSIKNARSFAFVLSKEFECVTQTSNGVEINYYYYKDEVPTNSLKTAVKSMEYFSSTFGEYPYKKYSVVQTEFIQGGMEFPALVMISDALQESAYNEVIVHETAHQWWQTAVGNNEIEYGFLDEGLTEYSVILFYENHSEYGLTRQQLIEQSEKTYKIFCTVSDKLFGQVNTTMLRGLKDFKSEYEYVNISYIKPCIMYEGIRLSIGEEKFFSALRSYYKTYKFKNANPDELVGEFEKQVKESSGYFKSYFEGKVII